MTNKEKFIQEIENSLHSEGGLHLSTEAMAYFEALKGGAPAEDLTETGKNILLWIREHTSKDQILFSAKVIGEGLFASPRSVSGATRKLVNDGLLYKEGKNPVSYGITALGLQVLPERESI